MPISLIEWIAQMSVQIDKAQVLASLIKLLERDLEVIVESQLESQAGAVHAENKAEGDKDMRATESSYLARGLAMRVAELRSSISTLSTLMLRTFTEESPAALSALVVVEDEEGARTTYFIATGGGGSTVILNDMPIAVITPNSPIGSALIGRRVDDEVELRTPHGLKTLEVCQLL